MKRFVWQGMIAATLLAMLISSCASNPSTTTAKTSVAPTQGNATLGPSPTAAGNTTTVTLKKLDGTTMTKAVEKPRYGGVFVWPLASDYTAWDPMTTQAIRCNHMQMTSNEMMGGNEPYRGPGGTGETDWTGSAMRIELETGELAESWEMPDNQTIIYHIRHNIHYFLNPLAGAENAAVNGREVTADDVVWNWRAQFNYPGLWQTTAYPPTNPDKVNDRILPGDPNRPTSITALDRYTVQVKVPAKSQGIMVLEIGDNGYTNPPECWTQFGGWGSDWRKIIGTGPFILTDYVQGSSVTYARNQNYFEHDSMFPDNQWPYIDKLKFLILPDLATRLAALRTGKVDFTQALYYEDAQTILNQHPELKYGHFKLSIPGIAAGRNDKAPFSDTRVRQAMNIAIDKQNILDNYYHGDGVLCAYPYPPTKAMSVFNTPLEQMPDNVKMLFKYDPAKAKQLLTDAGYPNGFKTTIISQNDTTTVDFLSILKGYLGKVGIDMTIDAREYGVWASIRQKGEQQEMMYGPAVQGANTPLMTQKGTVENISKIDDPWFAKAQETINASIVNNPDGYHKIDKELMVYELGTAWGIWTPEVYQWDIWWPWLHGYNGIGWTGWAGIYDWAKSVWIDQDLKKSLGY